MKLLISTMLVYFFLLSSTVVAGTSFTLSKYKTLKTRDMEMTELILGAMREAVFYAQESNTDAVICASPIPISGARLVEMLETEIANPTNIKARSYADGDFVAFILIHALKDHGACK